MKRKRTWKRRQIGHSGTGQPVVAVRLAPSEHAAFLTKADGLGLTTGKLLRALVRDYMGFTHDDSR